MKQGEFIKQVKMYVYIVFGCVVAGIGYNLFLVPASVAVGGFSGLAIIINELIGLPVGVVIIILNIPLFILGFIYLGKKFIAISIGTTILFSLIIDLIVFLPTVTTDRLLATIYGGIFVGVGLGLVLKAGSTTGGTDILAKLLEAKFKQFPVGQLIFFMDVAVILVAGLIFGIESGLYALIGSFISGRIIDMVIQGVSKAKGFFIITTMPIEISCVIMEELGRGVTQWQGKGLYTRKDKEILLCAVSNRAEIMRVKQIVKKMDKHAFILIANMTEVLGEGFYEIN